MFVKITSLATLPNNVLLIGFSDNKYKQFDLKPIINKYPPFKVLINVDGLYEQAKIDIGGYGIVWNDDLDISSDILYEQGMPCNPHQDI